MADNNSRDAARSRAQTHFAAAEQRDETVKQIIAQESAARDAKTAKLRALRLAKEEADRETARLNPAPTPERAAPNRKPRRTTAK